MWCIMHHIGELHYLVNIFSDQIRALITVRHQLPGLCNK